MKEQRVNEFALGTFEEGGEQFPGAVFGDRVVDLRIILPGISRIGDLFAHWNVHLDVVGSIDPNAVEARPLQGLNVLPPVQPVGSVIAAGANYREHVLQMSVAHNLGKEGADAAQLAADAGVEIDERGRSGDPYVWTGLPSAVCGAYDDVQLPDVGRNVDWEVELGVVIGRKAHRVAAEDAYDYIAGYTIVNDITARTLVPRNDIAMMGTDWFRAKNQPTFFPTGPYLIPRRFVADPAKLRIHLSLNGKLMQDALADDLLFDIPSLIAYASSVAVLLPGDVLITGSPAGNGSHWGRYLRDGDVMEAEISGLGTQRSMVRGPSGQLPPWYVDRPDAVAAAGGAAQ
ncbi:2-keto-4-pentenoate hydratase/2-oxohepta-3-ene-1,7-dioic acid hydratase in catechol pathway [Paenarthrobacter nicotinovorans]|uniref:2-keto-4-pentenoate hydratase/2-oxohepta-3-ene-1,7-dioic acid hydratase in catechol pathway n=1 Tax=Paenarthrobacter nicotinovorans TaxID=29320 RepID=A0ABT9TU91_PAENI|nr:fumarylacetoacetate hydrolase family protein [Paenarthrobacter nicotinovorans]MDQ0104804.1 2-keto-4-pentenoate hydratase/2-oxohepta-3-ene-1,7-dioic acid hydratase in catechol pathway [Paenarthrobacter nicotinovorans]